MDVSFYEQMTQQNCDVVYGIQSARKGGILERLSGNLFWKMINVLSGMDLPENVVTARLMTRRYVNALLLHEEREVFMAGLWLITGFEQKQQTVRKLNNSESTYTFRRKLSLFVNSVTAFSNLPLVGIFYVGLTIFAFACLYTGYLIINWQYFSSPLAGWTSVMASIWLIGGLVISFMG